MEKAPEMVVVEKDTLISRHTYYFTKDNIFKLEGYSALVSYFLLLCLVLIIVRALIGGASSTSLLIADALIFIVIAFMILWVYPKEKRIANFSLAEAEHEKSARKISWKSISKASISNTQLVFHQGKKIHTGHINGNPTDAARFFRSKLGNSFSE